jgi:hypothetical protein
MSSTDGSVPSRESDATWPRANHNSPRGRKAGRRLRRRVSAVLSIYVTLGLGFTFLHVLQVIH